MITPEQKDNIISWVSALRSGEYEQTTGQMRRDGGFCCLGIASEIKGINYRDDDTYFGYMFPTCSLPKGYLPTADWFMETYGFDVNKEFDIESLAENRLFQLNDNGWSFAKIADL